MVAKGLADAGNEVFVVAEKTSFSDEYRKSTIDANGFSDVFRCRLVCPKTRPLWIVNDLVSLVFSFLSTLRVIKVTRPHVVFTHKNAGLGAVYAAKLLSVPSVYVVRGYQHDCFNGEKILISEGGVRSCNLAKCDTAHVFGCAKVYSGQKSVLRALQLPFSVYSCFVMAVRRRAISNATILVGVSNAVKKSLQTVYPNNMVVKVFNPMAMADAPGSAVEHNPFGRCFVYVGRLAPSKGVSVLLSAFKRLHDAYPLCRLAVIGSGPEQNNLRELASQLELGSAVTFLGHVTPQEVFKFLKQKGFATVVPSLWEEAFGRVVIESMAMGVPVIASKMGGMAELIIDGENGLLVSPGNSEELSVAMRLLIENPCQHESFSKMGLIFVKKFGVKEVTQNYLKAIINASKKVKQ